MNPCCLVDSSCQKIGYPPDNCPPGSDWLESCVIRMCPALSPSHNAARLLNAHNIDGMIGADSNLEPQTDVVFTTSWLKNMLDNKAKMLRSLNHLFLHLSIHSFINSFVYSFVCFIHSLSYWFQHSCLILDAIIHPIKQCFNRPVMHAFIMSDYICCSLCNH